MGDEDWANDEGVVTGKERNGAVFFIDFLTKRFWFFVFVYWYRGT